MKTANSQADIARIIANGQAGLVAALGLGQGEGRLEAQVLLAKALGVNRAYLIAHAADIPDESRLNRYHAMLERRLAGEPVAYILGEKEFYGLNFQVGPAVLIPRPETELLVELALDRLPADRPARLLDLGTGSGAIAIAIARQRVKVDVVAIDRSGEALEIAQRNARSLQVTNVFFAQCDWCVGLGEGLFDIIVANPPYIRVNDPHLSQGDLRFEPLSALVAGDEGMASIMQIARSAPTHLCPGGRLMLEHGYDQAEKCRDILIGNGFCKVESISDLAGIQRVTLGVLK